MSNRKNGNNKDMGDIIDLDIAAEEEGFSGEITLTDEEGNDVRFEHLMTVELKGREYICLAPIDKVEDVEDDELVILRIDTDDDGNDVYVTIDDEEELDDVFEKYVELTEADEEDE